MPYPNNNVVDTTQDNKPGMVSNKPLGLSGSTSVTTAGISGPVPEDLDLVGKPVYGGLIIPRQKPGCDRHIIDGPEKKRKPPRTGWKYFEFDDPKYWIKAHKCGYIFTTGKYRVEDDPKEPKYYFGKYRHTKKLFEKEIWQIFVDGDYFYGVDFDDYGHEKYKDAEVKPPPPFTDLQVLDQYPGLRYCYAIIDSINSMRVKTKTIKKGDRKGQVIKSQPHRRFRLVFVLEKPLHSHDEVAAFIDWVHSEIPFASPDHRQTSQPIYGNKGVEPVRLDENIVPAAIVDKISDEVEAKLAKKKKEKAEREARRAELERLRRKRREARQAGQDSTSTSTSFDPLDSYDNAIDLACCTEAYAEMFMAEHSGEKVSDDGDGRVRYHHYSGKDGENNASDWYQYTEGEPNLVGTFSDNSKYYGYLDGHKSRPMAYVAKQIYADKYDYLSRQEVYWKIESDIIALFPQYDHGHRPKKYKPGQSSAVYVLCQSLEGIKQFLHDQSLEDIVSIDYDQYDEEWSPNVVIKRKDGSKITFLDYFCEFYFSSKWTKVFGDDKSSRTKVQRSRFKTINNYAKAYIKKIRTTKSERGNND